MGITEPGDTRLQSWFRGLLFRLILVHTIFQNISASLRNELSLFQNESCIALCQPGNEVRKTRVRIKLRRI